MGIVLHAYQPPYPIQKSDVVTRIVKNTYLPVPKALLESEIPVTVNINGSLTEILEAEHPSVIEAFITLHENGLLEFLASGCYHPILPLLPKEEIIRQIELNDKVNSKVFGSIYKPVGFFPPELGVSIDLCTILKGLGYRYIMLPNIATHGTPSKTPIYDINGILGVTRDREISNLISFHKLDHPNEFLDHVITHQSQYQAPTVLGMDMETYGEHHTRYFEFLIDCLKRCNTSTIETIVEMETKATPTLTINPSSWSTDLEQLKRNNNFPLWDDPSNSLHQLLNLHLHIINDLAGRLIPGDSNSNGAKLVAKCQTSCQFWWASGDGRFSKNLIHRGIRLQRTALEFLAKRSSKAETEFCLRMSDRIIKRIETSLEIQKPQYTSSESTE